MRPARTAAFGTALWIYLAVTLGVPVARGAFARVNFREHAVVVLAVWTCFVALARLRSPSPR
jgi:hypothetical protein